MTYKAYDFKEYAGRLGFGQGTINTYNSYLTRTDRALGGLDEAVEQRGHSALLEWARTTSEAPFDTQPSSARSVLKKYLQFLIDDQIPTDEIVQEAQDEANGLEPTGVAFRLEREMQAAVRAQLVNLEQGLVVADGGQERHVATGNIDIVARDATGKLVAIELKAGNCPAGALEQVLGYADSLGEETGESVRAILIASDFSDRLRAAARRTVDLRLVTYQFSLSFRDIVA
jgi:hypothetical protein